MALKCPNCQVDLRNRTTKTVNNECIVRTKKCPNCEYKLNTIEISASLYNKSAGFVLSLSEIIQESLDKYGKAHQK